MGSEQRGNTASPRDKRPALLAAAGALAALALLGLGIALMKERPEAGREPLAETARPAAAAPARKASEEDQRASAQHYLSGVIFFQKSNYDKAREEWELALKLDPGNDDAAAGLLRLKSITGR